jgi:hypothetical protein
VYTVIGASGTCGDTAYVTVHVNALPLLHVTSTSSLMCSNESATLSSSGADTYAWSSGETTAIIVINPTVTSSYTVTGTDGNGCINKATFTQTVNACLGINNNEEQLSFISVYPNPNAGDFTVETPKNIQVLIRDGLGQVVLEMPLPEGKNRILLSDQAKGIYFIELRSQSQSKTVKLVKQ